MMIRLLLLFTIVPLVEITLLIEVGRRIEVGPTIALVIATGVLGAWLARREGLRTLRHIQTDLAAGQLPADRMIDALLILTGAVVLITHGIITDCIGFLLLIPPARAAVRNRLKSRFRGKFTIVDPPGGSPPRRDDFIDVEARSPDE